MSLRKKLQTAAKVLTKLGVFELLTLTLRKLLRSKSAQVSLPDNLDFSNFQLVSKEDLNANFLISKLKHTTGQTLNTALESYDTFLISAQNCNQTERRTYFDPVYDLGPGASKIVFLLAMTEKVSCILETGVAAGRSTNTILHALAINGVGDLVSVDITPRVGELVAPEVRDRWTLKLLPKFRRMAAFKSLIGELESISMFLHDSNHDPTWQLFEIATVLEKHPAIAFLIIDDIQSDLLHYLSTLNLDNKPLIIDEGSKYSCLVIL